jgi:hypothetical protein
MNDTAIYLLSLPALAKALRLPEKWLRQVRTDRQHTKEMKDSLPGKP